MNQLPTDVFLEVRHESGWVDRLTVAGRYLRAADGLRFVPASAWSAARTANPDTLSPGALQRIRAAVARCDLAALPATLAAPAVVPGGGVPPRGGAPRLEQWTFTARLADGKVVTAAGQGDPRVPGTFGPLQPLFEALDFEVYAFFRYE
jgi:hypothetical protein